MQSLASEYIQFTFVFVPVYSTSLYKIASPEKVVGAPVLKKEKKSKLKGIFTCYLSLVFQCSLSCSLAWQVSGMFGQGMSHWIWL